MGLVFMLFVGILPPTGNQQSPWSPPVYEFVKAPLECLPFAGQHSESMGRMHEHIEDLVQNLEAVISTDQQDVEIDELRSNARPRYFEAFQSTSRCSRRHKLVVMPFAREGAFHTRRPPRAMPVTVLLVFTVLRCSHLSRHGQRATDRCIGTFVLVSSLLASILWIVDTLQADIFDMGHLVQCDALFRDEQPAKRKQQQHRPRLAVRPPPADRYSLGMVNVTFAHRIRAHTSSMTTATASSHTWGAPVLRDCTLHFERGERTALMGRIGSGKTTVLRILLGLHVPQQGDAYWDGEWYAERHLRQIRRAIGYVPQHPVLFDRTVLENVLYGNEERVSAAAATRLVEEVGLAQRLPDGVHTRVGKGGLQLSGGQRQLVWCLRRVWCLLQ